MFEPVTLKWQGRDVVIPAKRVLGAIAEVEQHISLSDLVKLKDGGKPPVARYALAYAAALRYAGETDIDDAEVYARMCSTDDGAEMAVDIAAMLKMMVPPDLPKVNNAGNLPPRLARQRTKK